MTFKERLESYVGTKIRIRYLKNIFKPIVVIGVLKSVEDDHIEISFEYTKTEKGKKTKLFIQEDFIRLTEIVEFWVNPEDQEESNGKLISIPPMPNSAQ